ncbi:hypothetical protein FRACA_1530015 [Frankia canadensis]|uniref:Uncharacterized protein n=1 Tax=Frankia canadensis TaxID=1836972 RepID=A0A2I2KM65_9ACTN|nr:hypothetical protein FRACA_1530015 [Frankia canadensis]SOU54043.1 hypothetical protein FRACA_1530015 [Frankia canadensis]
MGPAGPRSAGPRSAGGRRGADRTGVIAGATVPGREGTFTDAARALGMNTDGRERVVVTAAGGLSSSRECLGL